VPVDRVRVSLAPRAGLELRVALTF
jgi:hypothetical protein